MVKKRKAPDYYDLGDSLDIDIYVSGVITSLVRFSFVREKWEDVQTPKTIHEVISDYEACLYTMPDSAGIHLMEVIHDDLLRRYPLEELQASPTGENMRLYGKYQAYLRRVSNAPFRKEKRRGEYLEDKNLDVDWLALADDPKADPPELYDLIDLRRAYRDPRR